MKTIATLLTICSISAFSIAKPIPEITELHPKLHTLVFIHATGAGDSFENTMTNGMTISITNSSSYKPLPKELHGKEFKPMASALLNQMESPLICMLNQSEAQYEELASTTVEFGEQFSSSNSVLVGKVNLSTNSVQATSATLNFNLKFGEHDLKLDDYKIELGKWSPIILGGKEKTEFILIKLYDPQQ